MPDSRIEAEAMTGRFLLLARYAGGPTPDS